VPSPDEESHPAGGDPVADRLIAVLPLGQPTGGERRTLTEGEMSVLTSLTWLHSPMHSDRTYGESTILGGLVVPGVLLVPIAVGLVLGDMRRQLGALGLRGIAELSAQATFAHPVFFGDTVTASTTFTDARASRSRPGHVVVTIEHELRTQRDQLAMTLRKVTLYVGEEQSVGGP
jgi:acyl dehydratase